MALDEDSGKPSTGAKPGKVRATHASTYDEYITLFHPDIIPYTVWLYYGFNFSHHCYRAPGMPDHQSKICSLTNLYKQIYNMIDQR